MSDPRPNFFVIGTGRSGTTSLHHYLRQHPDIYVPSVKGPSHFFCCDFNPSRDRFVDEVASQHFVPDREHYWQLFRDAAGAKAIGEVSPVYLNSVHVAPKIAEVLPHARFVAIIRHPVDRIIARFSARRRDGLEKRGCLRQIMTEELEQPLQRDDGFGTYFPGACCARALQSYYDCFPSHQILVLRFESFQRKPETALQTIFEFLGVDDYPVDTTVHHNARRGLIRNHLLRTAWTASAALRIKMRPYLPLQLRDGVFEWVTKDTVTLAVSESLRRDMLSLFEGEITALEKLLDWDLSDWRRNR